MLEVEIKHYESQRERLLTTDLNRFALIKGENIIGIYDSDADAYAEGLRKIGNKPFLIKQITKEDGDTAGDSL